jgi:hypothetical protein
MHAIQIKERIGVFIAVPAVIEAFVIAPRLRQRGERSKQFVTALMFGGVSRCFGKIDGSGVCHRLGMKSELIRARSCPCRLGVSVPAPNTGQVASSDHNANRMTTLGSE